MSVDEIGNLMQIAIKKLRRPFRYRYYFKGYDRAEEWNRRFCTFTVKAVSEDMMDQRIKDSLGEMVTVYIDDLDLDARTKNKLVRNGGLKTVYDLISLLQAYPDGLFSIRNVGHKSVESIFEWMRESGLGDWIPEKFRDGENSP